MTTQAKTDSILKSCLALKAHINISLENPPLVETSKDGIALFIMTSTYKSFSAAIILCKQGFSEEADKICRSIYDGYSHLATILNDDSEATAVQYLTFDYVTRAKMHRNLSSIESFKEYMTQRERNPKTGDENINSVLEQSEEWRSKYHKNWNNWLSETTTKKAENIGLKQYFQTAYEMQSQLIHVLPSISNRYLENTNGVIKPKHKPSLDGISMPLASSFVLVLGVFERFNDHFKCFDPSLIRNITADWVDLMSEHRTHVATDRNK